MPNDTLDYASPFGALMTPTSVAAGRDAELDKVYGKQDFWVYQAAKAGNAMRDDLVKKGYMMTADDERAVVSQRLIEEAGKRAQEAVQTGEVTHEEAQKMMMQNVMTGLLSAGDFEGAMQIAPQLKAIEARDAELAKLYAQVSQAEAAATKGYTEAGAVAAKLPSEIALKEEQARTEIAKQGKLGREPAAKGGKSSTIGLTNSEIVKYSQTLAASMGVNRKIGQLYEMIVTNPAIGTDAGQQIGLFQRTLGAWGSQARSSASAAERNLDDQVLERNINSAEGRAALKNLEGKGVFKNDALRFQSTVMDLAYVLAKARDPGGRLSDADVENAIKIIGVSGDPVAMGDTLKQVALNQYEAIQDLTKANSDYKDERFTGGLKSVDDSMNELLALFDKYSTKKAAASSGPTTRGKGAPATAWKQNEDGTEVTTIEVKGAPVTIQRMGGK